jgi:DNA helicase II / ATP-dependent DNA helicase PcrA
LPHPVVEEELELLERVRDALSRMPPRDRAAEEGLVRELERVRELLVSGEEQKDRLALLEQWDRGAALLRQLRTSGEAPTVDPGSPYFAHLRLRENGRERDVCIGKATCIRGGVRVVDWRHAPVSQLFYRYEQGDRYEEELGGRNVAGEVVVRRTVSIRGGALERVDAPEGSFLRGSRDWQRVAGRGARLAGGEGAALRAWALDGATQRRLGTDPEGFARRADKRLPDVVGLLDAEQYDAIGHDGASFLVVRGSAGSGKTTVALHRIAYLTYQDPSLDAPDVLFLTLSPALRDYVSHVLPGLGVERVRVRTFPEWAEETVRRLFPALPETRRFDTPDAVRRVKLHPALDDALAAQVAKTPGAPRPAQVVDDWASVLANAPLLEAKLLAHPANSLSRPALRNAIDWCRARHEELLAWLEGDGESPAALDPEDDALLLRAWQRRIGPLPERPGVALRFRHIAVDEVQDFSLLELRVVRDTLADPPSLTLAGDMQQQTAAHTGSLSWDALLAGLSIPAPEVRTLRVAYRSTREIVHFARALLGSLAEDEPPAVMRTGPPVEVFPFSDAGAGVAFLADALRRLADEEPLASVAVLAPDPATSALYAEGLERSEVPRVRRVEHGRFAFAPGIEVTEVEQAKGLEFDYVVLVDVSAARFPDSPSARRLLHVGATRAVHQLWVITAPDPSPLLPAGLTSISAAAPTGRHESVI